MSKADANHPSGLPPSAVPSYVGLSGVIGLAIGVVLVLLIRPVFAWEQVILVLAAGIPMWFLEWKRAPEFSRKELDVSLADRVLWRLYGTLPYIFLCASIVYFLLIFSPRVIIGLFAFLDNTWFLLLILIPWLLFRPIYAAIDGLDSLGQSLALRKIPYNRWELLRGGFLKIFFLLLMFSFSSSWIDRLSQYTNDFSGGLLNVFLLCLAALYMVDTVFALIGYLSTSRRLDSHIRESNPYWWSWVVTLACYPPFFGWLTEIGLSRYRDGLEWHDWLGYDSVVAWLWGGLIIFLTCIYAWSSVVFGVRFSNLTHRGILTNGPYRYTKHPAYISKNISWWLISVPFISSFNASTAFFACSALAFVNIIYFFRAKAEEKHLMKDPIYQQYAAWIDKNGVISRIRFGLCFTKLSVRKLAVCVVLLAVSGALWMSVTEEGRVLRFMSANGLQGAVLVQHDASSGVVRFETYGSLVGKENEVYPIASLSKLVTAAAIRRLISSGVIELDSLVINELPDFNPVDPRFSDVTIRHLLQHRAGFNRDGSDDPLFYGSNIVGCERAIKIIENRKLDSNPGSEVYYSNIGYCILGSILEEKLGLPYERAVYNLLFDDKKPDWLYMGMPTDSSVLSDSEGINEWYLLGAAGGWFVKVEPFTLFLSTEFDEKVVGIIDSWPFDEGGSTDRFHYGVGWRVWRAGCWSHFGDLPGLFAFSVLNDQSIRLGVFDGRVRQLEDVLRIYAWCGN